MPPPLGDNRFALLSASPQRKRKKAQTITKELFPALPAVIKENPKYLIASALDTSKPLSKYSCFAVHKALKNVSTDILNISELRDGNLLLFVKNMNIANKFLQTKALLGICPVKFELHNNLNSTKGTIFAPCLNNVSENEIVDNLKDQGVTSVYKFLKFVDGKSAPSGVILLTFDLYHLPEKIEVSWYTTKVKQFYPNPMRCKSCQLLGHTLKRCKKTPVCANCSLPPHGDLSCSRTFCANCSGAHSSSSRDCPKFIQMKQIISIKTDKKCTMREAIALHKQQIPPQLNDNSTPFSNIIKQSATNQQQNIISNQTNFSKSNQINNNNNENPTNNSNTPTTNNKISTNSPSTIASGNNSLEMNSDDNQTQQRMLIDNFLAQMISIPHEFTSSLSSLPTNSSNLSLNPDSSNFALNPDSQATTSETNTLKEV